MQGRALEDGRQVFQHLLDFDDDLRKPFIPSKFAFLFQTIAFVTKRDEVFLEGDCISVQLVHRLLMVKASMPLSKLATLPVIR